MHGHTNVKFAFDYLNERLIPVAEQSKVWVCGRSLDEIAGSNPAGGRMSVACECCVLSGISLCDKPVTRPEEAYSVWCVSM